MQTHDIRVESSDYLPSNRNRSKCRPSSRLATKNQRQLSQQRITPVQLCAGILKRLSITSWKALLGTEINVAVSGLVALTRSRVDAKTEKDPSAPHSIMNQKKGTSRKGISRTILPTPPDTKTIGVSIMSERRDV